jgi:hypothetical protein
MESWERLALKNEQLDHYIKAGMAIAKKYYRRIDNSNAYAVALCKFYIFLR